jgi:hypothetical protein
MPFRAYALILMMTLAFGSGVYLSGLLVLYRASETASFDALIERQRQTDGLYFGFANPAGDYKLAAYARRKPEIVIFGSSRAHRQHQEFYDRPSYAMSGLVVGPDNAIQLFDLLIPVHKPNVIIFNLDFLSFCSMAAPVGPATLSRPTGRPQGPGWQTASQFALIPKLMADGVLSPQDAADIALGRFDGAPKGIHLFGLIALKRHMGFRLDGAISEVDDRLQDPADFEAAKEEVLTGTRHYPAGCHYDPSAMAYLETLQQDADHAGIKLIILLPPIAPSLYPLFTTAHANISGYWKTARQELAKRHFPELHDMLDGGAIGASDAEFADAVHGGDVSEARMLLKAADSPGTALAGIINRDFLERLIGTQAGKVAVEMAYFQTAQSARLRADSRSPSPVELVVF